MISRRSVVPNRRRIFFALWPEEGTRGLLEELSSRAHAVFGGRRMRTETLHMTLAFIGEVNAGCADVAQAGSDWLSSQRAFSMTIDQLRCWRHNRIVWCGPRQVPASLAGIARSLCERLGAAGFKLEARPFAAHVTLLRNADCRGVAPEFVPFEWKARQIVLVESLPLGGGARYEIIGRWLLAGSGEGTPQR